MEGRCEGVLPPWRSAMLPLRRQNIVNGAAPSAASRKKSSNSQPWTAPAVNIRTNLIIRRFKSNGRDCRCPHNTLLALECATFSFVRSHKMNLLRRREFLQTVGGSAALASISRVAWGVDYPTRPVRIIVGFPAGQSADLIARLIGQWLSERLGRPFIIENRPGAGTNIATEAVAHAEPDGHTLLCVSAPNVINTTLYPRVKFNFIQDIEPIGSLVRVPFVL